MVSIVDPKARHAWPAPSRITGVEMYRGAGCRRRMTGAQVACLDRAPAPRHPALRFSGIVRQFLRLRLAQAAFGLELIGPADPAIDAWRVPQRGGHGRALGLIVGIDLTRRGLDLERVECAGACRQLFAADHFGLAVEAERRPVLKVPALAFEAPILAHPKRQFDARPVGRRVLPDTVVDAAPVSIEHDWACTCRSPR